MRPSAISGVLCLVLTGCFGSPLLGNLRVMRDADGVDHVLVTYVEEPIDAGDNIGRTYYARIDSSGFSDPVPLPEMEVIVESGFATLHLDERGRPMVAGLCGDAVPLCFLDGGVWRPVEVDTDIPLEVVAPVTPWWSGGDFVGVWSGSQLWIVRDGVLEDVWPVELDPSLGMGVLDPVYASPGGAMVAMLHLRGGPQDRADGVRLECESMACTWRPRWRYEGLNFPPYTRDVQGSFRTNVEGEPLFVIRHEGEWLVVSGDGRQRASQSTPPATVATRPSGAIVLAQRPLGSGNTLEIWHGDDAELELQDTITTPFGFLSPDTWVEASADEVTAFMMFDGVLEAVTIGTSGTARRGWDFEVGRAL